MFTDRLTRDDLDRLLAPAGSWNPVPPAADRTPWTALLDQDVPRQAGDAILAQAEVDLAKPWPSLTASMARRFSQDGDRTGWDEAYSTGRRHRLALAVLAECCEHRGRFLDSIIDGLWLILDEASWCIPAHYHLGAMPRTAVQPLPRQDRMQVDIFAAETAMVLAETTHLLADRLDAVSPAIRQRVRNEVLRRVIDPVLKSDAWFWWDGHHNWSTWAAGNLLGAGAYLITDRQRDLDLTWRLLGVLDRFLSRYGQEGACDEGPMYWGVAGGYLLMSLELLYDRSGGRIDRYAEPLIRNLGHYMLNAYLGRGQFTCFADAKPVVPMHPERMARFASRCGDRELAVLADLSLRRFDPERPADLLGECFFGGTLTSLVRRFFWIDHGRRPQALKLPLQVWLPSVQVLVARSDPRDGQGLVVAAKAGHNAENHNHCDVGQSIVLLDGIPALIDVGVGTYSRQVFSEQRYDQWCIGSQGHAVPCIDGHRQQAGPGFGYRAAEEAERRHRGETIRAFAARDVAMIQEGGTFCLRMDLAPCYAETACIHRAVRTFKMQEETLEIEDDIAVAQGPAVIEEPFLTPQPVMAMGPGRWRIRCGLRDLEILIDPALARITAEPVPVDDPILAKAWGDRLTRLLGEARQEGSWWWRAGRWLKVEIETGDQPLIIEDLHLEETRFPLEDQTGCRTDDPGLDRLMAMCVRTLQCCMHESFMDCPYYEQQFWVGDARMQMLLSHHLSADDRLIRRCLTFLADTRWPQGPVMGRYPAPQRLCIPSFALGFCGMVWDFACYRGDPAFVTGLMPAVRATLDWFLAHRDESTGTVRTPNGWNYTDWVDGWKMGEPPVGVDQPSGLLSWWLVATLDETADLEAWLGEPELATRWRRQAAEIAIATDRCFWREDLGLYATDANRRHLCEHVQDLAAQGCRLPEVRRRRLAQTLPMAEGTIDRTNLFFDFYHFQALAALGRRDRLWPRLERYRAFAGLGLHTTPETAGSTRSDCHAWSAHPRLDLVWMVAGLVPLGPGANAVRLVPDLGPLQRLETGLPLPQGLVRCRLERNETTCHLDLDTPVPCHLADGRILTPGRHGLDLTTRER